MVSMVGGLAEVVVSLMGSGCCSPTKDVWRGEKAAFEVFVNKLASRF